MMSGTTQTSAEITKIVSLINDGYLLNKKCLAYIVQSTKRSAFTCNLTNTILANS